MKRIATQVALLLLTAVVGCGGMLPADSAGSASGQSVPNQIAPGTYVGENDCRTAFSELGVETEFLDVYFVTENFDTNGMVLGGGLPLFVGQVTTSTSGTDDQLSIVTSITPTLNGLVIQMALRNERCSNQCQFAFDGVCDEPTVCRPGLDCFDCGPIVLTGSSTVTYQVIDENQIRRVSSSYVQEEAADVQRQSTQCQAILTK